MKNIFNLLTYSGTIPFVLCAVCLCANIQQLPLLGSVETLLSAYALLISSFLAGSLWGQHLHVQGYWKRVLPILSNIIAVLIWLGYVRLSFDMQMAMFISAFVILLIVDYRLFQIHFLDRQVFRTRLIASAIVIMALTISGMHDALSATVYGWRGATHIKKGDCCLNGRVKGASAHHQIINIKARS